jgi:hypothetical protein
MMVFGADAPALIAMNRIEVGRWGRGPRHGRLSGFPAMGSGLPGASAVDLAFERVWGGSNDQGPRRR